MEEKLCCCCNHFEWDTDGGFCYFKGCPCTSDTLCSMVGNVSVNKDDDKEVMIPLSGLRYILDKLEKDWIIDSRQNGCIISEVENKYKDK